MKSRRIYIAAAYGDHALAAATASKLRRSDFLTTSTWHDVPMMPSEPTDRPTRQALCMRNYHNLLAADVLLLLWSENCRGSLVEAIEAYHGGREVLIVGDPVKMTLMLDRWGMRFFATVDDAIKALEAT